MNPKILLSCPIYDGKEYITERYLKRIKELTYDNYDILLVDTSKTTDFAKKLKEKGFNVIKLKYEENSKIALCNARNYIREYVLNNNYDYFFSLEQDLIPPKDIIEQLLSHNKEVVGGWYYICQFPNTRPCLSREWTMIDMKFTPKPPIMEELGQTELMKVFLGSFGCCLIRRDVLEKISFKILLTFPHHDDTWFYFDCDKNKIGVYIDTNLLIPHFQDYKWKDIFDNNIKHEKELLIPKEVDCKYQEIKI